MPKSYHLCIMSLKNPSNLNESRSSTHMITWALWSEFTKLPHVILEFQSIYEPLSDSSPDFVLFHACFGENALSRLAEIRKHVKHKTMVFMELTLPESYVDYSFTYLPQTITVPYEEVSLPCLCTALDEHNNVKTHNSILLDHIWPNYCGTDKEWSSRIYEWLEPYADRYSVAQLRRSGCAAFENFPSWVTPIAEKPYIEYLDITAHYETYILTHFGSYEHGVIDMAYRGTRVLVPILNDRPFIPQATIERLNLATFSTQDELLALLDAPPSIANQRKLFTDISDVVARIDAYCQENLDGR